MIGTEQERAALMDLVGKYGYALAEWSEYEGDPDDTEMWRLVDVRDGYLNAIRAMLAPDDAVLRERMLTAISATLVDHDATRKDYHPVVELTNAVLAVLRGEATERPTLTISVPCPTRGGCKRVRYWNDEVRPAQQHSLVTRDTHPCPDCTDGTIQRAVGCQSCRWATPIADDEIECALLLMKNRPDWGCLSWEAKA